MKRRDFFTRLVKTVTVVTVVPSVLKDSELNAKDFHKSMPDDYGDKEITDLKTTGDFQTVGCTGGAGSGYITHLIFPK